MLYRFRANKNLLLFYSNFAKQFYLASVNFIFLIEYSDNRGFHSAILPEENESARSAAGTNSGKRSYTLYRGHSGPVYSAAFSPFGDFLLSSSSDSTSMFNKFLLKFIWLYQYATVFINDFHISHVILKLLSEKGVYLISF